MLKQGRDVKLLIFQLCLTHDCMVREQSKKLRHEYQLGIGD